MAGWPDLRIGVYALDGTLVQEFTGTSRSGETSVSWQRDETIARGVYAWRLACGGACLGQARRH